MTINGSKADIQGNVTVRELLKTKGFIFPLLIVKINGTFVPREAYETTIVPENADVNVIHLMSGG